jgi:hypothetical protein
MQKNEFYFKYANCKLDDKLKILNFNELGMMTLNDVFTEIKKIDDKIRPDIIRQEKLLRVVEELNII